MSYLVYEFERRAYPLSDVPFMIGRDAASDIVVREPAVSRAHAELVPDEGEYVLRSVGATGTLLNGQPLEEPSKLVDGDTIGVGTVAFTFRRGRLPLGVSVVEEWIPDVHDPDAMTKRDTIKTPILGTTAQQASRGKGVSMLTLVLFVVMLAVAAWYFIGR